MGPLNQIRTIDQIHQTRPIGIIEHFGNAISEARAILPAFFSFILVQGHDRQKSKRRTDLPTTPLFSGPSS